MDGHVCYPLVVLPSKLGSFVPVSSELVVDPGRTGHSDSEAEALALLWQRFCKLAWLLFLAWGLLRRLRRQLIELRLQANFWRAQHQRAVQREAELAEQNQHLQGEIREWKRRLFGRKSESCSTTNPNNPQARSSTNKQRRSRGQQPGGKGHGRRRHDHLPTTHETCDVPEQQQCCAECGEPFEKIPGTADGSILEIDVRAHRRRYHRQRYRRH